MNENTNVQTPTADASLSPAMQQDETLEYDSMVFLSKLEQIIIRLNDKMVQTSTTLAIEYLTALTNHILEFTEQLPAVMARNFSLEALLARDTQNYAQLRPQHIRNNRLALDEFMDQGAMKYPSTFAQLCNDILRVVNIYLSINVKAFHSSRLGEQWRTLYTAFFKNLVKTVREIQANQQGA